MANFSIGIMDTGANMIGSLGNFFFFYKLENKIKPISIWTEKFSEFYFIKCNKAFYYIFKKIHWTFFLSKLYLKCILHFILIMLTLTQ